MNDSCPVKYGSKVYDVKHFLRDHPGGINTLKLYKGKGIMHAMEKYGHSISAYHMMKDLFVNPVNSDDFEYKSNLKDANLTGELSENRRIITNEESTKASEEIKFLEELEGRLDWSKPLFNQLVAIAPHYEKWMNTAVYRKCIIFSSPLIEKLTHTPWYLVPLFWVPIILYLGITQYSKLVASGYGDSLEEKPLTNLQFIYHVAIGLFLWTVVEYVLHRWVFHLKPGSSITMIKIHFLIHGIHHKTPFDGLRQVFPVIPAAIIAVVFYVPLSPMFTYPLVKYTGTIIGYVIYDMIHFYVHHGSPAAGSYLYVMKRYHSNHHFINNDKAYGISSKLWDFVFKTPVHVKPLEFSLHW